MPKMKKFRCAIVETLIRKVEVYGIDIDDAADRLAEKYNNSEIVLDANDFCDVEFEDWEEISSADDYHGEYE